MLNSRKSPIKNKISVCHTLPKYSNVIVHDILLGLTHIDGPYLQAWASADVSERVLVVIIHRSAKLRHKHKAKTTRLIVFTLFITYIHYTLYR